MNIRDARTGDAVNVTTHNELRTSGVVFTMPHYEADTNATVYMITHKIDAPDTSSNTIVWLNNTDTNSSFKLVVSEIILSAEANAEWEIYTGTTRSSGGGSLTPVNTNTASSNTLSATVYGSQTSNFVAVTGNKYYFGRYTNAAFIPLELSWDDTILLGYNSTLGISCKTTTSTNVYVNIILVSHESHI